MCDRSIDLLEKIRKILSIENGRCKVIKKTLNIDDHVDCDNDYVDRDVKLIRFRCFRTSYSLESLFQGRRSKKKTKKISSVKTKSSSSFNRVRSFVSTLHGSIPLIFTRSIRIETEFNRNYQRLTLDRSFARNDIF